MGFWGCGSLIVIAIALTALGTLIHAATGVIIAGICIGLVVAPIWLYNNAEEKYKKLVVIGTIAVIAVLAYLYNHYGSVEDAAPVAVIGISAIAIIVVIWGAVYDVSSTDSKGKETKFDSNTAFGCLGMLALLGITIYGFNAYGFWYGLAISIVSIFIGLLMAYYAGKNIQANQAYGVNIACNNCKDTGIVDGGPSKGHTCLCCGASSSPRVSKVISADRK